MKTRITSYLNFNGNCREAMTFYHSCLGGELTMQRIAESPMAAQMPSSAGAFILHSMIEHNDITLMGSDMMGNKLMNGNTIGLCLNCRTREEILHYFNKLADGGEVITPLHRSFWGAIYGELTDRYGMRWMFSHSEA